MTIIVHREAYNWPSRGCLEGYTDRTVIFSMNRDLSLYRYEKGI